MHKTAGKEREEKHTLDSLYRTMLVVQDDEDNYDHGESTVNTSSCVITRTVRNDKR
jgi:hypothetical protein